MKITLNGKRKEFPSSLNLRSAVTQLCGDKTAIVAEVNGNIIKLPEWEKTLLQEGDCVELVSFVGGG